MTRGDDGQREGTRRGQVIPECFRCAEIGAVDAEKAARDRVRRLVQVRVVKDGDRSTLGRALLCATCIGELIPLDPDPLHVGGRG